MPKIKTNRGAESVLKKRVPEKLKVVMHSQAIF